MRVLLLTHYFAPELGAPQTRLLETALELRRQGHQVRVLTGPPHYPGGRVLRGYSARAIRRDVIGAIPVIRLPMVARPNGGLLDRTIDQSTFAAAAAAAIPTVRWADVVLVESPPLFLGLTAAFHEVVSRRPYLFHVADPWPDFPIAMGALTNPVLRRVAFGIESIAYRRAGLITTVTPGLVALLDQKPAAHGKVRLLPNGVVVQRFATDLDPATARRRLGWPETKLTLVYVGSVGLAQGVATLIESVAPLAAEGVSLRIIGQGFERDQLALAAQAQGLNHIHFDPPVASAVVPSVLAAADAIVVMLRRGPLYEDSLPTKLVEGLAAARPLIVSAAGESDRLVSNAGAGYVAAPEDALALRAAIRSCMTDPARLARGAAGRRWAETTFDRGAIVARLGGYLEEIAASPPGFHAESDAHPSTGGG